MEHAHANARAWALFLNRTYPEDDTKRAGANHSRVWVVQHRGVLKAFVLVWHSHLDLVCLLSSGRQQSVDREEQQEPTHSKKKRKRKKKEEEKTERREKKEMKKENFEGEIQILELKKGGNRGGERREEKDGNFPLCVITHMM